MGFRVWSNVDSQSVVYNSSNNINLVIPPYYNYTNSYYLFPYNQSWSIINTNTNITTPTYPFNGTINTSQEIQIYNGHYGTGSTTDTTGGTNGYINYNSYYNNSLIYTGDPVPRTSTSYRYTTFVWKANLQGNQPNYFVFTFNNIKVDNSSANLIGSSAPYSLSSTQNPNPRFFLFYRTGSENDDPDANSNNSLWVDGNANGATIYENSDFTYNTALPRLNATNYNDPYTNNTVRAPASILSSISTNNLVVKVSAVPISYASNQLYIYCRFGNSMNNNITYESVTLSLSS